MYSLNASYYGSVFVTPSVITEKYIKMASFCALKTLLWILSRGGNFSCAEIAREIGSSEADTREALDYWVNEGVLVLNGSDASPTPVSSDSELKSVLAETKKKSSDAPLKKREAPEPPEFKLYRPSIEQIAKRADEDNGIRGLFNQAQEMLGKTIGYDMQAVLLMMYDSYGFGFDVILTLLQYCVEKGITSTAFVSDIAKRWYKQEIFTLEAAHEYVDFHNEADKLFADFKRLTGISAPKATPKQSDYIACWSKMGFSVEMMVLAYNETVDKTGKISFAYTDKILKNWHESGYKTPDDVENGKQKYKTDMQEKANSGRSYDINKALREAESDEIVYEKKKSKRSQSV